MSEKLFSHPKWNDNPLGNNKPIRSRKTEEEKRQIARIFHEILIAKGVICADEVQIIDATIVQKEK